MKETTGSKALELQKTDEKINAIDLQETMHKGNKSGDSFESQVQECVNRGKDLFPGDFFVEVQFKKERLLQNVIRQYFIPKRACPSPQFDQVVYKFTRSPDNLEFLWVVPDWQSVELLIRDAILLPLEQQDLVQFARDFKSGALLQRAMKLNKEHILST